VRVRLRQKYEYKKWCHVALPIVVLCVSSLRVVQCRTTTQEVPLRVVLLRALAILMWICIDASVMVPLPSLSLELSLQLSLSLSLFLSFSLFFSFSPSLSLSLPLSVSFSLSVSARVLSHTLSPMACRLAQRHKYGKMLTAMYYAEIV